MLNRLKKYSIFRYILYLIKKNNHASFHKLKQIAEELKKKEVDFYLIEPPKSFLISGLSSFEKKRIEKWTFDFNNITSERDKLEKIYGKNFDEQYLFSLYDGAKVVDFQGHKKLVDFENQFVHIQNGLRLTTDLPEEYKNKIHIFGACTVRGTGVEDSQTVASCLQRIVNEKYNNKYQVVNHGIGCGSTPMDDLYLIETTLFKSGDIVILLNSFTDSTSFYCRAHGLKYFETSSIFSNRKFEGEWFTDSTVHTNFLGNQKIAEQVFHIINESLERNTKSNIVFTITSNQNTVEHAKLNPELQKYLKMLQDLNLDVKNLSIGSIVMNCNPFTLGHLYLIETVSKKVDKLIIFVVEEDKSYFPFEDRIELVRKGVKHLTNVTVVPSGKFILSAETFPGYFYKENDKTAIIDASNDIDIFASLIAPTLNIKYRFAGDEPLDFVTNQYNNYMSEILPTYGIQFEVIKRKTSKKSVISASRVRECLKNKDFEQIKHLVPKSTYDYLIERFGTSDRNQR